MTDYQIPEWLQKRQARGIAAQLAVSLPSGTVPYLSIKGSRFTLWDAAGNERSVGALDDKLGVYLDVNICDSNAHLSKVYYARAYDPNAESFQAPDCWSDNGLAPSAQAAVPQHADCKTCPHNQWGSGTSRVTGKQTKACSDVQKLAIAVPGFPDMVFLLRVPPASLKNLGKYIQEISAFSIPGLGRRTDVSDLITRVYFMKDAVGILGFTSVNLVDEATAATADKALEAKMTEGLLGKNDQPYTGEVGVAPAIQAASISHSLPPPASPPPIPRAVEPTPPPPAPRGRGRPPKVAEAPATQAPFMPQQQTNGGQEAAPKAPGPTFGMQAASAVPDDMAARIAAALKLKT